MDSLIKQLNETLFFLNDFEKEFFILCQNNLIMMKNSINHSDDFFDTFFKDKTKEEIKEWINKEVEEW